MSRMEVVFHFLDERCVEGCDGKWLESVREVLGNNKINIFTFADSKRKFLSIGRSKYDNILLYGPRNC